MVSFPWRPGPPRTHQGDSGGADAVARAALGGAAGLILIERGQALSHSTEAACLRCDPVKRVTCQSHREDAMQ